MILHLRATQIALQFFSCFSLPPSQPYFGTDRQKLSVCFLPAVAVDTCGQCRLFSGLPISIIFT